MFEIREDIEIEVPPEVVWGYFEQLPRYYAEWHPDYLGCRWVNGDALAVGSVLEVRRRFGFFARNLRLVVTDVVPGRRLDYRVSRVWSGAFEVSTSYTATRVTSTTLFGTRTPVLGFLYDLTVLFGRLLGGVGSLDWYGRHQREEVENLKRLMESDVGT